MSDNRIQLPEHWATSVDNFCTESAAETLSDKNAPARPKAPTANAITKALRQNLYINFNKCLHYSINITTQCRGDHFH